MLPGDTNALSGVTSNWGTASHFRNPLTGKLTANVMPGFYYVTANDELIKTVLGSCVCACIRDTVSNIGGMNHYILPGTSSNHKTSCIGSSNSLENRYGQQAMDNLISALKNKGCKKENFEVKLFGGAHVMGFKSEIGAENCKFAEKYCESAGLTVHSYDMGDRHPRKIIYSPLTGKVKMMKLRGAYHGFISSMEMSNLASL